MYAFLGDVDCLWVSSLLLGETLLTRLATKLQTELRRGTAPINPRPKNQAAMTKLPKLHLISYAIEGLSENATAYLFSKGYASVVSSQATDETRSA